MQSFEILKKFKQICEENDIKYMLFYGTLIGAVRHKGFIPWDDDIDVAMKREDYNKFIDYCIKNENLIKPLELKHWKTCKKYIYPISRLSNSDYLVKYEGAKDYNLGCFIDIYPLDNFNSSSKVFRESKKMRRKIHFCGASGTLKFPSIIKNFLSKIYYIRCCFLNVNKVLKKHENNCIKHCNKDGELSGCVIWDGPMSYESKLLEDLILHDFEGEKFLIPRNYDAILKTCYGDYMKFPPENERVPHHCYKVFIK